MAGVVKEGGEDPKPIEFVGEKDGCRHIYYEGSGLHFRIKGGQLQVLDGREWVPSDQLKQRDLTVPFHISSEKEREKYKTSHASAAVPIKDKK